MPFAIKATPEEEGVLVLTYKEDGLDYVEQLQRVFVQAGIDINRKIVDAEGQTQPRLAFTTYGNHVGTNKFRYCSTGILAGVQQRHKADIAGSMCGARKSIASRVDFAEVDLVHQAVAASDAQQAIGRLQCRLLKNGKALPARIYIVHLDSSDHTFKSRLTKAFPKAGWTDQASENKLKESQAYQMSLIVEKVLGTNYDGTSVSPGVLRKWLADYWTSDHKNSYRLASNKLVQRSVQIFLDRRRDTWTKVGRSLIQFTNQAELK